MSHESTSDVAEPDRLAERWVSALPWLILVTLAFLLGLNQLADYDIWWHLRTGQLIPARGVPEVDWYTFTSSDRPWIDVHWGFQLVVATVHGAFGIPGLVVMKGIVVACVMGLAVACRPRPGAEMISFGVLLLALVVMSNRFYVRPEIFTLLYTALFLWILARAEERSAWLWALPALQVVWANTQGLFVFGPILFGMATCEVLLGAKRRRGSLMQWGIVGLLIAAACLVSPYGLRNVLFVADLWQKIDPEQGKFYRATIGELMDLRTFLAEGGGEGGFVYLLFGLMLLAVLGIAVQWRRIVFDREVFRLLPTIAFLWLAWQAVRNVSHFALIAGVLTTQNLADGRVTRRSTERRSAGVWPWGPVAICVVIGIYFVGGRWSAWIGSDRRFGIGPHPEQYSFAMMDLVARPGLPERAFVTHLGNAAEFIYAAGPERKVFMDPRLEVNSEQTYRAYKEIEESFASGSAWHSRLQAEGIDLVVVSSKQSFHAQSALWSSPYWHSLHWDPVVGVFLRSTIPLPEGIQVFDLRRRLFAVETPVGAAPFAPQHVGASGWGSLSPYFPRRSPERHEIESLLKLSQSLALRAEAPETLVDTVLARLLILARRQDRFGESSGETSDLARAVVASTGFLAERWGGKTAESPAPVDFLSALGAAWARWEWQRDPRDWTSAFYFQEMLARIGAVDESARVIDALLAQPPRTSVHRALRPELESLAKRRRERLDSKPSSEAALDRASSQTNGRLGEYLERELRRLESDPKEVASEETIRLLLLTGHPVPVPAWERLPAESLVRAVGRLLATGEVGEIEGGGSVDRLLVAALAALVDGDAPRLRKLLDAIDRAESSEEQQRLVARLRDLFFEEAEDR